MASGSDLMTNQRIDLKGQTFGELVVIRLSEQTLDNGTRLWECACSCGRTTYVAGVSLRAGYYKSCGCQRIKKRDAGVQDHIKRDLVNGTRKSALNAKLHKGNKSGHKGVQWMESRQKWRSYIGYQGKNINLGYYSNLDDAIEARKQGEEKYHNPHK